MKTNEEYQAMLPEHWEMVMPDSINMIKVSLDTLEYLRSIRDHQADDILFEVSKLVDLGYYTLYVVLFQTTLKYDIVTTPFLLTPEYELEAKENDYLTLH